MYTFGRKRSKPARRKELGANDIIHDFIARRATYEFKRPYITRKDIIDRRVRYIKTIDSWLHHGKQNHTVNYKSVPAAKTIAFSAERILPSSVLWWVCNLELKSSWSRVCGAWFFFCSLCIFLYIAKTLKSNIRHCHAPNFLFSTANWSFGRAVAK